MKFLNYEIVFQEIPNEISLAFQITGCKLACKGCHSKELWNPKNGEELTNEKFETILKKYNDYISCVAFFGGEWYKKDLIDKLKIAKKYNLKTCLYTGEEDISSDIKSHLDFLKVGKWIEELGPLSSPTTNQKFIDLNNNKILNNLFIV